MSKSQDPLVLRTTPRQAWWLLLSIIGTLTLAGIAARATILATQDPGTVEVARRFDLDAEHNIPTWFASTALLAAAMLLGVVARGRWRAGAADRRHWAGLAILFTLLSLDEAVQMHEMLRHPMHEWFDLRGIFLFAWVIPVFFAVVGFAAVYLRFWLRLPSRTRALFFVSGVLYVGGALGLELAGGALAESHGFESLRYSAVMIVEEVMEMVGVALFLYALLDHVRAETSTFGLALAPDGEPASPAGVFPWSRRAPAVAD